MKKAEKENVRNLKNVPDFNPEEWGEYVDAGCYPYALDLKVNKFFLIGSFIGKVCVSNTSDEELIETLKEELETIFDYEVEEIEPEINLQKEEKRFIFNGITTLDTIIFLEKIVMVSGRTNIRENCQTGKILLDK